MNMQVSTKERVLQVQSECYWCRASVTGAERVLLVQKEKNCWVTLELKIYSCCCFCCMEQTKLVKQITQARQKLSL